MAKDLTDALRVLTEQASGQTTRTDKTLPAVKVATAIPERVGSSGPITAAGASGIASPLTEESAAAREYYTAGWVTSDGLFTLPAIKKVVMTDRLGNEVVFNYAEPV
jgi:hypothetical protein